MNRDGYSFIEVVVASAIFLVFSGAVVQTVTAAQTSGNRTAAQNGAQLAINFLSDRLQQGRSNYAPIPLLSGNVTDYTREAVLNWNFGELTEPYQGRNEDYAKPQLYRASVRYTGFSTVRYGSSDLRRANYTIGVCYKTSASISGEECINQTINAPLPDPTTRPKGQQTSPGSGGGTQNPQPTTPPAPSKYNLTFGPAEAQPSFPLIAQKLCVTTTVKRIVGGTPVSNEGTFNFLITENSRPNPVTLNLENGTYELRSVQNVDCPTEALVTMRISAAGQDGSRNVSDNSRTDTVRLDRNREVRYGTQPMEWLVRLNWIDREGQSYRTPVISGRSINPAQLQISNGRAQAYVTPESLIPGAVSNNLSILGVPGRPNLLRIRGAVNPIKFETFNGNESITGKVQCFQAIWATGTPQRKADDMSSGCQAIDFSTLIDSQLPVNTRSISSLSLNPQPNGTITDLPVTVSTSLHNVQMTFSGVNKGFWQAYYCFRNVENLLAKKRWLMNGGYNEDPEYRLMREHNPPLVDENNNWNDSLTKPDPNQMTEFSRRQQYGNVMQDLCELIPYSLSELNTQPVSDSADQSSNDQAPVDTGNGESSGGAAQPGTTASGNSAPSFKPLISFPYDAEIQKAGSDEPRRDVHTSLYNPFLEITEGGDLQAFITTPVVGTRRMQLNVPQVIPIGSPQNPDRRMRHHSLQSGIDTYVVRSDSSTELYGDYYHEVKIEDDTGVRWDID